MLGFVNERNRPIQRLLQTSGLYGVCYSTVIVCLKNFEITSSIVEFSINATQRILLLDPIEEVWRRSRRKLEDILELIPQRATGRGQ